MSNNSYAFSDSNEWCKIDKTNHANKYLLLIKFNGKIARHIQVYLNFQIIVGRNSIILVGVLS